MVYCVTGANNWRPAIMSVLSAFAKYAAIVAALAALAPAALAAELPFATHKVVTTESARLYMLDGVVEAVNQATVSAQTSGRIAEIRFDVDDVVKKDQLLVRFNDTQQRASARSAEAALKETLTRADELATEFDRARALFAKGTIAQARLDTVKANFAAAKSRAEAARAQALQAREQLAYTEVRAPYGGVVTKRHVETGELANAGQPLMTGFSLEKLRIRVDVPQKFSDPVRRGARAFVLHNGMRVAVTSVTVFPFAAPASNTFTARLMLPDRHDGLYPGMLVKVTFDLGKVKRISIPAAAIAYRGELVAVYVVKDDGGLTLRQIRPGRRQGDGTVAVLAGLNAGETIALDPVAASIHRSAGQQK